MIGEKYQRFKLRKFSILRKILDNFEFDVSTMSQKRIEGCVCPSAVCKQLLDGLERNVVLFLSQDSSCSTVLGRLYPIFHFMMLQMFSLVKVVQPWSLLLQSHAVVFDADLVLSS